MFSLVIIIIIISLPYYGTMRRTSQIPIITDKVVIVQPWAETYDKMLEALHQAKYAIAYKLSNIFSIDYLENVKNRMKISEILSMFKIIFRSITEDDIDIKVVGEVEASWIEDTNVYLVTIRDYEHKRVLTFHLIDKTNKPNINTLDQLYNHIRNLIQVIFPNGVKLFSDIINDALNIINDVISAMKKMKK